jgi:hypothetical protein
MSVLLSSLFSTTPSNYLNQNPANRNRHPFSSINFYKVQKPDQSKMYVFNTILLESVKVIQNQINLFIFINPVIQEVY